jgi:hypothetical protein
LILKTTSRNAAHSSNINQVIQYVTRYTLKEKHSQIEKEEATIIYRYNLRGQSIEAIIQEYKNNESFRIYKKKNSCLLYHDMLSFSPLDKKHITNNMLKEFVLKYIELRGKDNLYLAVAHRGKTAHTHMHIIVSGIKTNGFSSRQSKSEFKKMLVELEQFQREKYPQLEYSKNEHSYQTHKNKEKLLIHFKQTRQKNKAALLQAINAAYNNSTSVEEFIKNISTNKQQPYYRNNQLEGLIVDGKRYRLSKLGFAHDQIQKLDKENTMLSELNLLRTEANRHVKRNFSKDFDTVNVFESIRKQSEQRGFNLNESILPNSDYDISFNK